LSPAATARKGYFDPLRVREAVTRLEALARCGDPWQAWGRPGFARRLHEMYRHGMSVNLILTVHLWDDLFLRNAAPAPGADVATAAGAPREG
jgi:hypothetical protein